MIILKRLCIATTAALVLGLALFVFVNCSSQQLSSPQIAAHLDLSTPTSTINEPFVPIERAEAFITGDPGAILITEQDFRLAIAESTYYQVDDTIRERAIQLTTQANDPYALGIVGDVQITDRPQPFQGTLFVVLRDPNITNDGQRVVSVDYFVAAVELSGKALLIGTNVRFGTSSPEKFGRGQPGNCCGKDTICVPSQTPTCNDPRGYCPPLFAGVGVSDIVPNPQQQRMDQGLPAVNLLVYPSKLPQGSMGSTVPKGPQILGSCNLVRDKSCDVKTPVCFPGDIGYVENESGQADPGAGSCGEQPQPGGGRNVPKICTLILTADGLPPECGGVCEFCGKPSIASLDGTPPYCKYASFGPDYEGPCRPKSEAQKQLENLAMWAKLGFQDGVLCEPTGKYGIKVCTTCKGGKCSEQYTPPDYSDIATGTSKKELRMDPICFKQIAPGSEKTHEVPCEGTSEEPGQKSPDPKGDNPKPKEPQGNSSPSQTSGDSSSPSSPGPDEESKRKKEEGEESGPDEVKEYLRQERIFEALLRDKSNRAADPVLIGDGSLHMQETDLSFEGPVRPLVFQRTYNSRSNRRSTLGSNWTHNWDVRIQPLTIDTTPVWALPYCAGSDSTTTCLFLHDGNTGGMQLFFYDPASQLYMPQAGNTDTIAAIKGGQEGWVLRRADGHQLYFNAQGYLVNDRDRFGNGFTLAYERTPLFEMYDYYCNPAALAARNETKYARRCAVLAYLLDDAIQPEPRGDAWLIPTTAQLDRDYPFPDDPVLRSQLAYARAYFVYLLKTGPGVESIFGSHRLRLIQVTDDLSRTLTFSYTHAPLQASSPATAPAFDFAGTPQAELLETVSGPAGTQVRFVYARPVTYPTALNEMFLVDVGRSDTPVATDVEPAATRHIHYQYQWPQGPALSYDGPPFTANNTAGYAASVFARFSDYYKTFVGCGYRLDESAFCPGRFGRFEFAPGNPQFLARQREWAYISDVADNIILVDTSSVIASETRYDVDPTSPLFDRVTAQRYGSSSTRQDTPPPDAPLDNWQTTLPKVTLSYVSAGPADPSAKTELTSAFLPLEIQTRYPLENAPPFTPTAPITRAIGVSLEMQTLYPFDGVPIFTPTFPITRVIGLTPTTSSIPACSFTDMISARQKLPGYRDTRPYYDVPLPITGTEFAQPLRRTWLTCDQLAEAQLGDPTHNDLLSTQVPYTITLTPATTPGLTRTLVLTYYAPSRIVGQRQVVAQNLNRICSWTKLVNRDGDTHYYGLNYRGQALVDAVRERATGQYIYQEQLFNADGLVIQERRPTRGLTPWQPSNGWISYAYDEIDPDGNRGWNGWLPVYWNRRMNLRRVETYASGTEITLTIPITLPSGSSSVFTTTVGAVSDDVDSVTGVTVTSTGRYQNFRYEPLFNQLWSTEEGSLEVRSHPTGTVVVDVPQTRLDYVFDYQELALSPTATLTSTMQPVLDHLLPWGYNWILTETKTVTGTTAYTYNYPAIQSWQLPLAFYDRDLNGDGVQGFGYGSLAAHRARGVPILAIRQDDSGVTSLLSQTLTYIWAPHGLPAVVIGPDDEMSLFEYYSISSTDTITAAYGSSRPPSDQEVSIGYRGLLARVRTRQFASFYDEAYGPADAPCPKLAGPYQWLLAADCSSPQQELEARGLPRETVSAILSSTVISSTDRWQTAAFSYSEIGQPRITWDESRATQVVRDTDGRERRITDPISSTTSTTYTVLGFPEHTVKVDSQGQILQEIYRRFDEEGRVLYTCDALVPGGCNPLGSLSPISGVVQLATYYPEGNVRTTTDPEGLVTGLQYNERQLLTRERIYHPAYPAALPRLTTYAYNTDSDVTAIDYGAHNPRLPFLGGFVLSETVAYDGLRRMTTYTDTRGFDWQVAYSNRDLITRYKRDDTPYPQPALAKPSWEVILQYDGLGRLEKRLDNGILTAQYKRTSGDNVFSFSAAGLGESFTTYDATGRPVWSRDAAGNQTISTLRTATYIATDTKIRTNDVGRPLTTTAIVRLDPLGRPVTETQYGAGDEREWIWHRDGNGHVLAETNPEGFITRYRRNLLGWPHLVFEQRNLAGEFDISEFRYNGRGQISQIIDPANQITEFIYTPFGETREHNLPGTPNVHLAYSYDGLGRLQRENTGTATIEHIYDRRGDPILDQIDEHSVKHPLVTRFFDDLGRLSDAVNHNYALSWLAPGDRQVAQTWTYDDLGRVQQESIRVGSGPLRTVISNWNLSPTGTWQRDLSYASAGAVQAQWREGYDLIGRLAWKDRLLPGPSALHTTFNWLGDIYLGRVQDQANHASPFREERTVDAFGLPLSWRYSAIDWDNGTRMPANTQEGQQYCGSQWMPSECARPLLKLEVLRDVMGRIASLQWQFGNPVFNSNRLVGTNHPQPWRGYAYNPMGQLSQTWEHSGVSNPVSTAGVKTHGVKTEDIDQLADSFGGEEWSYIRELAVGDTVAIRNTAGVDRWSLPTPRGPGHQIQQVAIDGVTRTLNYDAAGRIQVDGQRGYSYDPVGRLAGVTANGQMVEAYAYDALGRLIAVFSGTSGQPATSFLYDGDQMLAAFNARNQTQWEATWGPGLDQLIEWRDLAGGSGDYIPLVDHRDSVVGAWNVQQSRMVNLGEYSPEGRLLLRNPDESTKCEEQGSGTVCSNPGGLPFGFVSAWRSQASGLVYMRNRWYSPELGQFVSQDPAGYTDSYNPYAYVGFDSVNGWDPWGLDTQGLAKPPQNSAHTVAKPKENPFWRGFRMAAQQHVQQAVVGQLKSILFGPDLYGMATSLRDAYRQGGWLNAINVFNPVNKLLEAYYRAESEAEKAVDLMKVGDVVGAELHAEQSGAAYFSAFPAAVELGQFAAGGLQVVRRVTGPRGPRVGPESTPCSFSSDTLVTTSDGKQAISTLEVGDIVLAYDKLTDNTGYYTVTAVLKHDDPVEVYLTIDGDKIETTPEHPFFAQEYGWVPAGKLWVGAYVQNAQGNYGTVQAIALVRHTQLMYNLTVAGTHTFFVGDQQWLIHNQCPLGKGHGSEYKSAAREFKRWSLIDPNIPNFIKSWLQQQLKQKGWGKYWKNPPGYDIGHNKPGIDKPWNFRWESSDMNRYRGGKYGR
ncbi:MAG: hypothetical protein FOGNACKC_06309 [Anaerolineae bacterium]|nr:hypothetical protein [Anaerolineae bacterium]